MESFTTQSNTTPTLQSKRQHYHDWKLKNYKLAIEQSLSMKKVQQTYQGVAAEPTKTDLIVSDPELFQMQNNFYEPANLFVTEENEMFLSEHSDFSALCSLLYSS